MRALVTTLLLLAGAGVGRRHAGQADASPLDGEALVQCVRSVIERTHHGDEPTHDDRLFYSHPQKYFNRAWGADYLLSHPYAIKYFQIPKSGSTNIRTRMSYQFDIPYRLGYKPPGFPKKEKENKFPRGAGGTYAENRIKPAFLSGEALEYFTFTMVAEPVIRLVHGIQQAKVKRSFNPKQVGEIVAKTIRALIDQDRAPTGNWTSGRCSKHCDPKKRPRDQHGPHNVHMAGQLTLLMDMFLADTLPRLDYVGVVEQFDASWNGTLRAYQQYNDLHGVKVDPERYTPKPIEARGRHRGHDEEEMWAVLRHDPQLLCDAAHMLEFDYECLPTYNLSRWCDGNASHAVPA